MPGLYNEHLASVFKAFSEEHSAWKFATDEEKAKLRFEVQTIVREIDYPKSIKLDNRMYVKGSGEIHK